MCTCESETYVSESLKFLENESRERVREGVCVCARERECVCVYVCGRETYESESP